MDGAKFAVEVSPAITIVLHYLLGAGSGFKASWSEFEGLAALHEFALVAIKNDPSQKVMLTKLPARFPPSNWKGGSINLPVLDKFTVAINKEVASYADVIAPYRLIQCKFTEDVGLNPVNLYLQEEIEKMGLSLER